jgi:hypothetical protein
MPGIAILTSTSPLRKTSTRHGVTKQRLNFQLCGELVTKFDVIIVGSTAPDEVFAHVARNLPKEMRSRFRFYNRSFFRSFLTKSTSRASSKVDPRDAGWEEILAESKISFEPIRSLPAAGSGSLSNRFDWRNMGDFITDTRVTLISGGEGQLFFEMPAGTKR